MSDTFALCKTEGQMSVPFWAQGAQLLWVFRKNGVCWIVAPEAIAPPKQIISKGWKLVKTNSAKEIPPGEILVSSTIDQEALWIVR